MTPKNYNKFDKASEQLNSLSFNLKQEPNILILTSTNLTWIIYEYPLIAIFYPCFR